MSQDDLKPLLDSAKDHFNKGHYKLAEPLLQQLQSENYPKADVSYMLATIAFDRGQLKKAIALFKNSLEVDPKFTDSSVGLSIILNDLGRYEEAKKVFEDAYSIMKRKQKVGKDNYLNDKLARKHSELGDLYTMHDMFDEAVEEYTKASKLMPKAEDYSTKLAETLLKAKGDPASITELEKSLSEKYEVGKHMQLVEAYSKNGQTDKARFELDKAQLRNGVRPEIESWRQRLDDLTF